MSRVEGTVQEPAAHKPWLGHFLASEGSFQIGDEVQTIEIARSADGQADSGSLFEHLESIRPESFLGPSGPYPGPAASALLPSEHLNGERSGMDRLADRALPRGWPPD